ncbi:MAG: translational machinery protein [Alphaproteobacteria bacterium]|nr:translational machinery protein [Alphaproteobacteria bacterium]
MPHYHAVVWIDHREARVFPFNAEEVDKLVIHAHNPAHQIHHKAGVLGSGHAAEDQAFYHAVAQALSTVHEALIVGPGQAKTALLKHLARHDPQIADKIVAVETVDHLSDGQVVAFARKYFVAADRMRPQRG